ncbi:hypothetical protein DRQ53_15330 [bacterium]|nr:MAG: hypothetical protein DRQ53_15330 [bacterium]
MHYATIILTLLLPIASAFAQRRPARFVESDRVKLFEMKSDLLSEFWGREIRMQAGVVLPSGWSPDSKKTWPVCYNIHGFGGSHRAAMRSGRKLMQAMDGGDYPRMLYVFLNASCPQGHHEFVDSVNNGPWGKALTTEFIPALELRFRAVAKPHGRFLTGHSSGGWSSFWLQITYADYFGGTWSTAPDSVDFRDFTGINVYAWKNAYTDPKGEPIQLMRRGKRWVMTIQQYVQREHARKSYGGQFSSFDYVFSPKGEDGRPLPLFDRKTGKIDPVVATSWEKYDIRLILKHHWKTLGPKLQGKLRIYMGTLDTFRLEGASKLLKQELAELGSDAEILLVEGRDHGSLFRPHPTLWPQGMMRHIHEDMWRTFENVKTKK